ncbi:hydrolase [Bacteroidia bacterium]|nr:hydrolase [Bacteroidia bacterium]
MSTINHDLTHIRGFVFDVDGVLSAESIPLFPTGEAMRFTNTKDGFAITTASRQGFILAIITGGDTEAVRIRYEHLGCQYVYLKSKQKINDLHDLMQKTGLKPEEMCYAGDDIPDIECMQAVGLSVAPADAVPEVKAIANYISHKKGGDGVARDVIEQVLKVQNKWAMTAHATG